MSCLYFKAKGTRTKVYNFDNPTEQALMDDEPIDEDMNDAEETVQPRDKQPEANQGWGNWVPIKWSLTYYQPATSAPPHTATVAPSISS